jgi:type IV pilus assembly protein PilB
MALKLGELLLKAQLINQQQLTKALEEQKVSGGKLGEILQRLGYVTEDDIIECLSHQFGVPSINLRHFEVDTTWRRSYRWTWRASTTSSR